MIETLIGYIVSSSIALTLIIVNLLLKKSNPTKGKVILMIMLALIPVTSSIFAIYGIYLFFAGIYRWAKPFLDSPFYPEEVEVIEDDGITD